MINIDIHSCTASHQVPSMDAITRAFLMSMSMEDGLYFQDYCGEHESMYPGTSQLAGTINGTIISMSHIYGII